MSEFDLSEQMFMLFFSILYGIMLNGAIGLRAFPLASALMCKDMVKKECHKRPKFEEGWRSLRRVFLSIWLLNVFPFIYFAFAFHFIGYFIGDLPSGNLICTIIQVVSIGILSLGVFAFYRIFLGFIVWKWKVFYTQCEYDEIVWKRSLYHRSSLPHFVSGILYLIIPLVVIFLSKAICFFLN